MRLVITGTRRGRHDVGHWLGQFARKHGVPELTVLGDAEGVDQQAMTFLVLAGWTFARVAVNAKLAVPDRFHDRNQRMVGFAGPGDVCLAFPDGQSRGTFDCLNRARRAGLVGHILPLRVTR